MGAARPDIGCFVTGTDTGVGKTWISAGLLHALSLRGRRVAGMKPIASGAEPGRDGGLRNRDALTLQSLCTSAVNYDDVNPYVFADPTAPFVAAERAGVIIRMAPIIAAFERLSAQAEAVIVEGIGGWRVPISRELQIADIARALDLPVVLVVGLRLGCISHALLTAECIDRDGIPMAGWVANAVDRDYLSARATVEFLETRIRAPLLGEVAHLAVADVNAIASSLDLSLIPDW